MPDFDDHHDKASHNEDFVADLGNEFGTEYNDWVLIGNYYAAVKYIDEVLDNNGFRPKNHRQRENYMERTNSISPRANSTYETLKDLSRQARYECVKITPGLVNTSESALRIIKNEIL